jgi:hypothetical protein
VKYRDDDADDRLAGTPSALAYLPQLLAYPLTGFCPPVMGLVSVFFALGMQSLFGIPLLVFSVTWMLQYLMTVIEQTAHGHAVPPPLSGDALFLDGWRTFKTLCLPLLAVSACTALAGSAPGAARTIAALAAFVMPAYLFSLAIDGDLASALNPLRWLKVMTGLGSAYLLPCLLLAIGAASLMWMSRTVSLGLVAFAFCYLLFLTAHLLGFVAYHRRDVIGLDTHVDDPGDKRLRAQQAEKLDAVLARVDERLKAGELEPAVQALLDEPGGPFNLRGFHEDVFERIATRGSPELMHAQGRRLIGVLLDEKRDHRALEVFETCENRHPGFEPAKPSQSLRLVQEALAARLFDRFEALVARLEASHPGSPEAVSAAFLRARYVSEQCGDDARAREILKPLLAARAHPQHAQIMAFARALAQIGGATRS